MTALDPSLELPPAVIAYCAANGGPIAATEPLKGGAVSTALRLTLASGDTLVMKQCASAPPDLYEREAEGLRALAAARGPRVPHVHAIGTTFLLLEDMRGEAPREHYWEDFGHAIATLHQHTSAQFGFEHDNYLGLLVQRNPWTTDGHAFFAQQRILRYIEVPLCQDVMTAADRQNIERFAARLPELIPVQPAALLHGDLWFANMLVGPQGEPAVIDPGVYYGWPEAELSMTRQCGQVPDTFFAAYQEVNPLEPGWWERLELLYVREYLSMVAHFGNRYGSLDKLRELVDQFV